MLRSLRSRSGGPSPAMRVLALVLALLLAGPLTILLVQGAQRLLDLAY